MDLPTQWAVEADGRPLSGCTVGMGLCSLDIVEVCNALFGRRKACIEQGYFNILTKWITV